MSAIKSPLKSCKTDWDLTLLYASPQDRRIERDVRETERAFKSFAKKYGADKRFLKSETALERALLDYERLIAMPETSRPALYFSYIRELDSQNQEAEAMLNRLSDRLTKAENTVIFFALELGKIPKTKQQAFLKSARLKPYRYFLKNLFENSKHDLSEAEEKVLNLKDLPSHALWVQGFEKLLNKQVVRHEGKDLPIGEAMNLIPQLSLEPRRALHRAVMETFRGISDFAESELNAIVIDKKIEDELRGFKRPYSATVLSYENDEASVMNLVKTVTRHFPVSHRYYALKAKLLGLPKLTYADRSADVGATKKRIPFKEAVEIIRTVFYGVHPRYGEIFDRFLAEGQIDVFPKQGKAGGAFCSSSIGVPTFVLLNQVDDFRSLSTIAHEMGHAIHSERSKTQRPLYQHYTTSVAETASTFFENLLFHAVFKELSKEEQIVALHDKIGSDISGIARQIACFNFELELHETIRKKGSLSKEEMAALLNRHIAAYLGPVFELEERDGYFFTYWSHIRRFFYVYSYAYGELISRALYEMYRKDNRSIDVIDAFLSAGGSKKPEDIFKDIGIDTSKPAFFARGLASIEKDIDELAVLIKTRAK